MSTHFSVHIYCSCVQIEFIYVFLCIWCELLSCPPIRPDFPGTSQQDVLRCSRSTRTHRAHGPAERHLAGDRRRSDHLHALLPFIEGALPRSRPHSRPPLHLRPRGVRVFVLGGRQRQLAVAASGQTITEPDGRKPSD